VRVSVRVMVSDYHNDDDYGDETNEEMRGLDDIQSHRFNGGGKGRYLLGSSVERIELGWELVVLRGQQRIEVPAHDVEQVTSDLKEVRVVVG